MDGWMDEMEESTNIFQKKKNWLNELTMCSRCVCLFVEIK